MKIKQVEVFHVHKRQSTGQRPILVRIDTDEGIHGLGEVGMAYGIGGGAGAAMVKDLAALVLGRDPFASEAIWNDFLQRTFWGKGGGIVFFAAASAIDTALWDIKARALGVPLYQLLGGKTNGRLRAYASQIQFGWNRPKRAFLREPAEYADAALTAVAGGYDAVKVDLIDIDAGGVSRGPKLAGPLRSEVVRLAESRLAAIRNAVGDDVDIIVENHSYTDTNGAIQLAKALEDYRVFFYEETTSPLNPELMARIKAKTSIPLAAGERIASRYGFRPFLEARTLDVIQPDAGICGGVSEFKKISEMAAVYDVAVQAHVAGTGVAEAVALHLEAAIPNFTIHEHHQKALLPEYAELVERAYLPENGSFSPPESVGIGQELTDAVYAQSDRALVR